MLQISLSAGFTEAEEKLHLLLKQQRQITFPHQARPIFKLLRHAVQLNDTREIQ